MGCLRAVRLAVCLIVGPAMLANAAPPTPAPTQTEGEAEGEQDCDCEDQLSVEECVLARAIQLNGDGQDKFAAGDYAGAIAVWEEAIILLPESKRVRLSAPLANAHVKAHEVDGDLEHLRKAQDLFTAHLEYLGAGDEKARAETEAELAAITAEFEQIESERDQKIRAEEAVLRAAALADAQADSTRRIRRIYYAVGGSLASLGVVSMATMIVGLRYGESRDELGEQYAMDDNTPQTNYDTLLRQGRGANAAAWATGVIGGAALIAGTAVLVVGLLEYKPEGSPQDGPGQDGPGRDGRAREDRARVAPHGLGFRF